jgi:DNA-binding NtrC family response regulator
VSTNASERFEVLVADDDPGICDVLEEFFRSHGLPVATVRDGRAALHALERSDGRFRLVLTDMAMPGADGFAVLSAARAASPECYVVVITGYASLDTAIQAVRLGAHDYLPKPFSLGQIEVILHRAHGRFARERRNPLGAAGAAKALASIESRLTDIERTLEQILAAIGQEVSRR